MESNMKLVAHKIVDLLNIYLTGKCECTGCCDKCDANDLCKAAMNLRDRAQTELDKREKPEVSVTPKPEQSEADQHKALCEALTDTVNKLHGMMEHAIREEDIETVLDISGQIIDCAECIVKMQSGMVDAKLLEELMQCQKEAEGEET